MSVTLDAPVRVIDNVDDLIQTEDLWAIVVWNDDVNTFQNVIKALIDIMHHSLARAEQLTMAVHNTGKAVVGIRPRDEAVASARAFHLRKIQASIERA
jgi:ATP-dependent Clp protease adaptor protein ClpS